LFLHDVAVSFLGQAAASRNMSSAFSYVRYQSQEGRPARQGIPIGLPLGQEQ
jgi:hypothetical protein